MKVESKGFEPCFRTSTIECPTADPKELPGTAVVIIELNPCF